MGVKIVSREKKNKQTGSMQFGLNRVKRTSPGNLLEAKLDIYAETYSEICNKET